MNSILVIAVVFIIVQYFIMESKRIENEYKEKIKQIEARCGVKV